MTKERILSEFSNTAKVFSTMYSVTNGLLSFTFTYAEIRGICSFISFLNFIQISVVHKSDSMIRYL